MFLTEFEKQHNTVQTLWLTNFTNSTYGWGSKILKLDKINKVLNIMKLLNSMKSWVDNGLENVATVKNINNEFEAIKSSPTNNTKINTDAISLTDLESQVNNINLEKEILDKFTLLEREKGR